MEQRKPRFNNTQILGLAFTAYALCSIGRPRCIGHGDLWWVIKFTLQIIKRFVIVFLVF
jgi:hypothetical protein